jgi:NAD(P)-dependent dehydrogenase (short-subunit alcohol dehydrogenase family)
MALAELAGRVAVVTGAASGIGAALVGRCAAAGMRVVAADVDADGLAAVRERVAAAGGEVAVEVVDVSVAEEVVALAGAAHRRHGAVHLLVNNAGVGLRGLAWERSLDDWRWVLGVNLWGVIHGVQAFVPRMLERGEPAHVVNTASIAGLLTAPRSCIYTTSKFGVVGLSECLLHDLAAVGAPIGVSVLCPGFVRSGIVDAERHRPARLAGGPPPPDTAEERALEARTRAGVAAGRDPALVADQVLDAVRQGRFWVFTHPEYAAAYEQRFAGIVAGRPPAVGFGGGGPADVPIDAGHVPGPSSGG